MRCAAITRAGERCKAEATHGSKRSYCWSHAPETAEARKQRARRGGQAGGNGRPGVGDVAQVRQEIRGVIGGVLKGKIPRGTGSVLFMGFNVLLRAIEVERKIREQDDILERLEALEAMEPETGGRSSWRR